MNDGRETKQHSATSVLMDEGGKEMKKRKRNTSLNGEGRERDEVEFRKKKNARMQHVQE